MKRTNIYKLSAAVLCSITLLAACKKNELHLQDIIDPSNGSYFKIGWFSPALTTQGVQLKINGQRVSNQLGYKFTSTTTYAMPFPGGGLNTGGNNKNDYLAVDTGDIQVTLTVPKVGTADDSISILNTSLKVSKGKFYTLIISDSFPAAKSYVLNDDVEYADSGFIKLNFTNSIPNLSGVDFLVTNSNVTDQVLATNVPFQGSTGFLTLPLVVGTSTFKIRKTGTTTPFLGTYATSSVGNKRCFTVVARGYIGGTGIGVPAISLIYNK